MSKHLKAFICSMLARLSREERREVLNYLEDLDAGFEQNLYEIAEEIREKRFQKGLVCPHCESDQVVRFGKDNGQQRYRCKSCKRTFTDFTGTPLGKLQKKEEFFHSLTCMLDGDVLSKTAEKVGISVPTAFSWRHKVLDALRSAEEDELSGIIEVDDTYFLYSEKGNRNLDRPPRRRGGKAKKRGISKEQVCVVVGCDRNGRAVSDVACHGRPTAEDVDQVLRINTDQKAILCTDKHTALKRFANLKQIKHQELNISKGRRTIKGIYHIQNVNSYHSRLKNWMRRFKGVATKYLSNYLHWFDFVDRIGKNIKQEVATKELLFMACSGRAA